MCIDIRKILEHLIEHVLLDDVVRRFDRAVHAQKIMRLARIQLEDCELIDSLMTKYSRFMHGQPSEAPVTLPLPDEIQEDLEKLIAWRDEFSRRK